MSIFGAKLKLKTQTKLDGGLYPGGGGGGLIIGCIFWFTGRWAYNRGGGGGAYKQQFMVF